MTMTLCVLKATDVVCIVGGGIPDGLYLDICDPVLWGIQSYQIWLQRDLVCVAFFFEMANLATKPSSCDDGLVARLAISTTGGIFP